MKHNSSMEVQTTSNRTCSLTSISGTEDICFLVLAVLLAVMAIFVNGSLISVVVKTKLLQTCTNTFIVSLATAEFLFGFGIIFAGLSRVCSHVAKDSILCIGTAFIQTLGRSAAFLNLTILCVDRAMAVSKPLKYSRIITPETAAGMIGYTWLHSTVFSILPFLGAGQYSYNPKYAMCIFQTHSSGSHIAKEVLAFIIPSFVIFVCIYVVIKQGRSQHRVFAIVRIPIPAATVYKQHLPIGRSMFKSLRSLFFVIAGYALFCFPFFALRFTNYINPSKVSSLNLQITMWLSFLCCVLNPLVITLSSKTFKLRFKEIVLCRKLKERCDNDGFNVITGLHTILEATMMAGFIKQDYGTFQKHIDKSKNQMEYALRLSTTSNPVTLRSNIHSIA